MHDGVAARDRIRDEPERNHAGKIERRDHRADAERLADHDLVDAGGDVFGVVALNQDGRAARHVDVLDGAAHLAARFGERLAAFERDGPGDLVEVPLEQILELEQELHAVGDRRPAPGGKRAARARRPPLPTSAAVESGVVPMCSPVAGLRTGIESAADEATHSPPT